FLCGEGKRIMHSTRNVLDDMMKQQVTRVRDKHAQESSNLRLNSSMLYVLVPLLYLAWLLSLRGRTGRPRRTACCCSGADCWIPGRACREGASPAVSSCHPPRSAWNP